MTNNRTISAIIDVEQPDLTHDEALAIIDQHIVAKIPSNHEYEYTFLDFGIQDGIGRVQVMFSADVKIWSGDDRRNQEQD